MKQDVLHSKLRKSDPETCRTSLEAVFDENGFRWIIILRCLGDRIVRVYQGLNLMQELHQMVSRS
jgi:hypothetical protein